MPFALVDDGFLDSPKAIMAGEDAADLYLHGLIWCKKHLTDGVIPKEALPKLTSRKSAADSVKKLCDPKIVLWEDCGTHWQVHDYLDWNEPSEVILKRRAELSAKRSEAGCRGNAKRWQGHSPKPRKVIANGSQLAIVPQQGAGSPAAGVGSVQPPAGADAGNQQETDDPASQTDRKRIADRSPETETEIGKREDPPYPPPEPARSVPTRMAPRPDDTVATLTDPELLEILDRASDHVVHGFGMGRAEHAVCDAIRRRPWTVAKLEEFCRAMRDRAPELFPGDKAAERRRRDHGVTIEYLAGWCEAGEYDCRALVRALDNFGHLGDPSPRTNGTPPPVRTGPRLSADEIARMARAQHTPQEASDVAKG